MGFDPAAFAALVVVRLHEEPPGSSPVKTPMRRAGESYALRCQRPNRAA